MNFRALVLAGTIILGLKGTGHAYPVPPSPEAVLRSADAVIVGSFVIEGGVWKLSVIRTLKGKWNPGERVPVYPASETFHYMVNAVEDQPFLFCGEYLERENVLVPVYEMGSTMPMGVPGELLPPRTLAETITYAEGILGLRGSTNTVPGPWLYEWPSPWEHVRVFYCVPFTPKMEEAGAQRKKLMEADRKEGERQAREAEQRRKEEWRETIRNQRAMARLRPPQPSGFFHTLLTPRGGGMVTGILLGTAGLPLLARLLTRRRRT